MKTLLGILFALSFSLTSNAQCDIPEPFLGNTGNNMTIMLLPDFISSLPITSENSYLVAFNSNGQTVGSTNVYNLSQTTLEYEKIHSTIIQPLKEQMQEFAR